MLKASGTFSALEVSRDGETVAVLNDAKLAFSLGGKDYTIKRSGLIGPLYELQQDGVTLLSAKQASFTLSFTVSFGDRSWTLKGLKLSERRFGLFDGAAEVGRIWPADRIHYTRDITIDLPDEMPLAGQVFLMCLLLWKWSAPVT